MKRKSVNCVVDSFNVYHFIDKLKISRADWIVLFELSSSIAQDHPEKLMPVVYFTDFVMDVSHYEYSNVTSKHLEKNRALN